MTPCFMVFDDEKCLFKKWTRVDKLMDNKYTKVQSPERLSNDWFGSLYLNSSFYEPKVRTERPPVKGDYSF